MAISTLMKTSEEEDDDDTIVLPRKEDFKDGVVTVSCTTEPLPSNNKKSCVEFTVLVKLTIF